ncbi:hypothetical protein TEA_022112 [Camellia sinensis var. sinensis]|uniref:Uncharacterized protein n=1 Tax=Camellia sinensis var. sinensis TaxID=542762 RepID=A0A4S4DBG3_CAMSN|nr:hypothetical protein TEA_022112 [Camellia sinensis var. sinensis]
MEGGEETWQSEVQRQPHPYVPKDLNLAGFVPGFLSQSTILTVFGFSSLLVFSLVWFLSGFKRPFKWSFHDLCRQGLLSNYFWCASGEACKISIGRSSECLSGPLQLPLVESASHEDDKRPIRDKWYQSQPRSPVMGTIRYVGLPLSTFIVRSAPRVVSARSGFPVGRGTDKHGGRQGNVSLTRASGTSGGSISRTDLLGMQVLHQAPYKRISLLAARQAG